MSANNGGPAFPAEVLGVDELGEYRAPVPGMTLRDYFAAKAMRFVPEMTAFNIKDNESRPDFIVRKSYEIADAMLKERDK